MPTGGVRGGAEGGVGGYRGGGDEALVWGREVVECLGVLRESLGVEETLGTQFLALLVQKYKF